MAVKGIILLSLNLIMIQLATSSVLPQLEDPACPPGLHYHTGNHCGMAHLAVRKTDSCFAKPQATCQNDLCGKPAGGIMWTETDEATGEKVRIPKRECCDPKDLDTQNLCTCEGKTCTSNDERIKRNAVCIVNPCYKCRVEWFVGKYEVTGPCGGDLPDAELLQVVNNPNVVDRWESSV